MDKDYQDPNELFAIFDDKGHRIGQAKRSDVHGNPALVHRAVHVLIFNSCGELYLQKRAENKDVQPGKWDSSVGGHVGLNEGYETAAHRETREELGIREKLNLIHLYDFLWRTDFETEAIRTFFAVFDGPIQPNPAEISEGRFWTLDEITSCDNRDIFTPNFLHEMILYAEIT